MKVTVYLGANMGDNPSFKKATIALGQWIAKNGHTLVYGLSLIHISEPTRPY